VHEGAAALDVHTTSTAQSRGCKVGRHMNARTFLAEPIMFLAFPGANPTGLHIHHQAPSEVGHSPTTPHQHSHGPHANSTCDLFVVMASSPYLIMDSTSL
jgi:hypothetical protein